MNDSIVVSAFAKINLSLKVLGRLPNGFHELDTVFQSVDLADVLELSLVDSPGIELVVEGDVPSLPAADASNLAWLAARQFIDHLEWKRRTPPGVRIRLEKRIPIGAGLGGGSSDAAAVLVALDKLTKLTERIEPGSDNRLALSAMASRLGSDVPYFLVGGTARGTGRGDVVEPIEEIPTTELVLIVPPVMVSTAEIFGRYAANSRTPNLPESRSADRSVAPRKGGFGHETPFDLAVRGNDLQQVVFDLYPKVAAVYTACQESHAVSVQLSGSGGCVFARFPAAADSKESVLGSRLPKGCRVYEARTLSRTDLEQRRAID